MCTRLSPHGWDSYFDICRDDSKVLLIYTAKLETLRDTDIKQQILWKIYGYYIKYQFWLLLHD